MTYTPTPVRTTADALCAEVAGYVNMQTFQEALDAALFGIHDAEDRLNMRPWIFTRAITTVTLSADALDYALPDTWGSPFRALFLDTANAERSSVGWKDPKNFFATYQNRSRQGSPVCYTVFNGFGLGVLSLNCFPSSQFISQRPKIKLYHNGTIQTINATGDGLAIPRKVESFVKWHAKAHIAAQFDPSAYAIAKREAEQAWTMLVEDNNELDFRASQSGYWAMDSSGAGGSLAPGVPHGAVLPSTGNEFDVFGLDGPPSVYYQWMIAADSTSGWVEISRGPDGPIT